MDLILLLILVSAAIGLIVGFVKGFTKVKAWANDVVLSALCVALIMKALKNNTPDWMKIYINGVEITNFVITLVLCVLFILLFTFISYRAKKFFTKGIEKRKLKSYYEQYEDREETEEELVDALNCKDEKKFNSLIKKDFHESEGTIGVLNRVCGSLTLAIKGAVIAFWTVSAVLVLLDLAHLEGVDFIGSLLESNTWLAIKGYALDFLFVALISLCIRSGYKGGLFTSLWSVAVILLIALAGYLSYYLAFNVEEFIQLSEGLAVNIAEAVAPITDITANYGVTAEFIAKILVTLFIFVFALVIVILIAVFVPKILKSARDSAIFKTIDGILGAIVALALVLGLIAFMCKILYDLRALDFMNRLDTYFTESIIANALYTDNILNALIQTNFLQWFIPQ